LIVNISRFKSPWVVLSVIFVIFQWLTVIFCHAIITQKSFKWFFNDRQNTFVCFFNTSYKISRNESLFYFFRECEIYNSFDCDEIKTTKKIERKLAIHQARAQRLRVAKKLAWRLLLFSKKRCVEKGKDDYVSKFCVFKTGTHKFKKWCKFLFLIFGGVVVNGCYKK
jgi:hypothetical protein